MAEGREVSRTTRAAQAGTQALVITRLFDAPCTAVWKAWTDPQMFRLWWGPKGFTSPSCAIDLRVGGKYLFSMRSADGLEFWSTGNFQEIVPLARLIFTDCFADDRGNVVPATHYGLSSDYPLELRVVLTFQEQAGRTTLTLEHSGLPTGEMVELTKDSWNESLDKLAALLAREELR